MSVPEAPGRERHGLVCFDFEGRWGMPFVARYDLEASTQAILDVLARHRAHATFFVVGALAIEQPDIVAAIGAAGHEIALHGVEHEQLVDPSPSQVALFGEGLDESAAAIAAVTGSAPSGFRAPHLLAPRFFDRAVYELLGSRGFRWASNRELRHAVELFRPDRIGTDRAWRLMKSRPRLLEGRLAHATRFALNSNVYLWNTHPPQFWLRWLRADCPPFYRGQILEVPLYAPMDCDLIGLPDPSTPSPRSILDFARFALEFCVGHANALTMLTFHDWIISGAGRLELLDSVLAFMAEEEVRPVSVREAWPHLIRLSYEEG